MHEYSAAAHATHDTDPNDWSGVPRHWRPAVLDRTIASVVRAPLVARSLRRHLDSCARRPWSVQAGRSGVDADRLCVGRSRILHAVAPASLPASSEAQPAYLLHGDRACGRAPRPAEHRGRAAVACLAPSNARRASEPTSAATRSTCVNRSMDITRTSRSTRSTARARTTHKMPRAPSCAHLRRRRDTQDTCSRTRARWRPSYVPVDEVGQRRGGGGAPFPLAPSRTRYVEFDITGCMLSGRLCCARHSRTASCPLRSKSAPASLNIIGACRRSRAANRIADSGARKTVSLVQKIPPRKAWTARSASSGAPRQLPRPRVGPRMRPRGSSLRPV